MELSFVEKAFEFGFAAVIALLLLIILWKLGQSVIQAFDRMYHSHKEDLMKLAEEHRTERKECYANQEKQIAKFDETIRLVAGKK